MGHLSPSLLVAVASVLLGALACLDDTVEVPEVEVGEPYCMIAGAWGTFADGSMRYISTPNGSPAGCGCSEPEHSWDADFLAALNELAYAECVEAAQPWDFVSTQCLELYELSKDCLERVVPWDFTTDECRDHYEAGAWLPSVRWVGEGSGLEYFAPPNLHCSGGFYPEAGP